MGTFNIIPKDFSTITCSLNTDETSDYIVLASSINMNEARRLEVLYAAGAGGGAVRKSRRGLAEITFRMVVFGTTSETLLGNYRALVTAVTAERGGTVQYKPRGLGASVLDTYYHYLQSPPPRIVRQGHLDPRSLEKLTRIGGEGGELGILCEIKLMTRAWATSDPTSPVTIISSTTIYNRDDTTHNNYIVVPNTSIKGDAVFPIIYLNRDGASGSTLDVIIHKRKMLAGGGTNHDWEEAENMDGVGTWSNVVDTNSSNGSHERSNDANTWKIWDFSAGIDSTYIGKVVPMICVKVDAGTEYEVKFRFLCSGTYGAAYNPETEPLTIDQDDWMFLFATEEIGFPYFPIPDTVTDDSTPDIGTYLADLEMHVVFTRTSGSGYVYFDFAVLPRAGDWLCKFDAQQITMTYTGASKYVADAYSGLSYVYDSSGQKIRAGLTKTGPPLTDLVLEKGFDHKIRVFFLDGFYYDEEFDQTVEHSIGIKGIYGTIYPFSET